MLKVLPGMSGVDCNSMEAVNPGFGESFQTAEEADQAMDKNFDVQMQYKVSLENIVWFTL